MPVITGAAEYPDHVIEAIERAGAQVIAEDALSLAVEAGSPKAVNVVLIGLMAKRMQFGKQVWLDALRATVPEKFLEMNLRAFELGYSRS